MTNNKVWFITGDDRGVGVDFAKATLAAGTAVVAIGRNPDAVAKAIGEANDLLVVKPDVTSPEDAEAAGTAARGRFGRIDVLVNNAGNFTSSKARFGLAASSTGLCASTRCLTATGR